MDSTTTEKWAHTLAQVTNMLLSTGLPRGRGQPCFVCSFIQPLPRMLCMVAQPPPPRCQVTWLPLPRQLPQPTRLATGTLQPVTSHHTSTHRGKRRDPAVKSQRLPGLRLRIPGAHREHPGCAGSPG